MCPLWLSFLSASSCTESTYSSGSRYSSSSVMGGEEGESFVRAMMCWSVMSVWVLVSDTWASPAGPTALRCGARRRTWTTMGSLAVRKASTAWSWVALETSLPLTWKKMKRGRISNRRSLLPQLVVVCINQRHLARGCAEEPSFSIRASKGRGGTQKRSLRELMEDQRNASLDQMRFNVK